MQAVVQMHTSDVMAWFLNHWDYFADEEGGVKHEAVGRHFALGVWVNVIKNPRLKQIEFPALRVAIDIQKQLALAPIAIRAQVRQQIRQNVCAAGHGGGMAVHHACARQRS